ncbi:ABC transporter substrate-binding protein [Mesorhizobium sp. LjRoot246]|uniref:ABC transporter substrate-binding protein n=1 Tax=Mesorhizobium sp. LjRoot246 TaxID=3342294 RepID=UPI003ED15E61
MTSERKTDASRRNFLKSAGMSGLGSAAIMAGLNSSAAAQSSEPVIIGAPLPLTGVASPDGIEFQRGLEMAAKEINALGGILGRQVKIVVADTQSGGDDLIVSAGQGLIDRDGANVLISGYNFGSQTALQNLTADASMVYLNADTARAHCDLVKKDPEKYWGSFMYCPSEYFYGYSYLDFIKRLEDSAQLKLSNRKLAIITGPLTYSINIAQSIRDTAKKYNLEVSLYETVQAPTSEWGPTLAKLRADPPALIAVTHFFPQDQAQFMLQFITNPTNSLIYMQYGASLGIFRDVAGDASEGVLYATSLGVLEDELGNAFTKNYLGAYGDNASPLSGAQTYTALYMYSIAAALAGGAGKAYEADQNRKIADRLKSLIYRSVFGSVHFDPETQSVFSYPVQTDDPSLAAPLCYNQIQDKTKSGFLIAPKPYNHHDFVLPKWMKA